MGWFNEFKWWKKSEKRVEWTRLRAKDGHIFVCKEITLSNGGGSRSCDRIVCNDEAWVDFFRDYDPFNRLPALALNACDRSVLDDCLMPDQWKLPGEESLALAA